MMNFMRSRSPDKVIHTAEKNLWNFNLKIKLDEQIYVEDLNALIKHIHT